MVGATERPSSTDGSKDSHASREPSGGDPLSPPTSNKVAPGTGISVSGERTIDQHVDKTVDNEVGAARAIEDVDPPLNLDMGKRENVTVATILDWSGSIRDYGTAHPDFFGGLVQQVVNASSNGPRPDELGAKFMLAFIKREKPRDEIDAMLLAQIGATHVATMKAANRLAHAESVPELDSAERTYNKLCRTFAALVDTLQRHRGRGHDVTVHHHQSVMVAQLTSTSPAEAAGQLRSPRPSRLIEEEQNDEK